MNTTSKPFTKSELDKAVKEMQKYGIKPPYVLITHPTTVIDPEILELLDVVVDRNPNLPEGRTFITIGDYGQEEV